MARPVGHPLKFQSAKEIEDKAEEYFSRTPINQWTITGVALALDTSRETLMNYEKKEEFFDTIKRIKTKVENSYELSLRVSGRAGDIFGLKNFGWKDKSEQDIDVTSKGESIVMYLPEKLPDNYGDNTKAE